MNPFAGAPKQQYYPDSSAGICRPNSPEKPEWINILVSNYRQCCEEHIPWDVENCVKNEPVAENVSAPKQLYYPDSSAGFCKPNSPEKPEWINILVSSYRQCCEEHLPFHFEKCLENEPVIENEPETNPYFSAIGPTTPDPTTSPTESPYKGFYADPSLKKCLPNSPSKPAWNKDVALTRLDCCKKYLDWAFIECVADIPPTLRPTSAEGDMPDGTTSSPTEALTLTAASMPRMPEWNTNIAPTHLECCKKFLDWAFAECVRNIAPSLRPTQTPTTAKPTEAPFTAEPTISSVPTSRPTTSPTTLYWKPTSAPNTPSPTNQPTIANPTSAPTTSAPTRSPSTILYYADTALSYCLEDSLDRPQWNQDFTTDYTECCKTLLPWVYGDCMKMKPMDTVTTTTSSTALSSSTEAALVTRDPTSSPTKTRYYADTTLSRCIEDSITRPSWIEESALESDYSQCCKIHLDWVYDACMKHAPKEPVMEEEMVEVDATVPVVVDCPSLRQRKCKRNVSCVWLIVPQRRCEYKVSQNSAASSTTTTTTTVATTTPSLYKYYVNTINGKCLIHTADTPSWVTIHKNFEECCDASWFDNCNEFIPMAPMSEAVGSNEEEHKVIEVVARGTLNLYFQATLPSPSSLEWTRLIKALRETFMTIFQESEQYHPEIELTLVSLGYISLMQRLLSSALEPAEDGGQHRQLQELTKLEFELTIPILCNSDCQMNTWNVGLDTFEIMERHFLESANSGVFSTLLFESGKELGIFSATTDAPVAGDAKLTYQYSFSSKKTWMPSPGPTSLKMEEEPAADEEVEVELDLEFYPDYVNDVCKSDGNPPDYEDNFFDTLEDCCNFAWIHYATCKKNSVVVTRPPTPNPTRVPTRVPTQKPSPMPSPSHQSQLVIVYSKTQEQPVL
ncbi:hypothetical protein QTG54_005360 [Skeletonema marinoi]|uniref:Uncharacterized protein n=1 Tax=Skeletonema marinoi TaxID=267567 RepID=A0AAD8YDF5_9STRA|nr:hypothetical protein QTG54_005360 [Skeletonema marinoi]